MVGGNDRVSVWQSLGATGIVEWFRGEVVIGDLPDRFPFLVDFDRQVTNRAID